MLGKAPVVAVVPCLTHVLGHLLAHFVEAYSHGIAQSHGCHSLWLLGQKQAKEFLKDNSKVKECALSAKSDKVWYCHKVKI
jgi:predicted HD phosphohydrolase